MKRRNFLKLCCAAVVAPSLPLPSTEQTLPPYDDIHYLIAQRMFAARQAVIADLEERLFAVGDLAIDTSEDTRCYMYGMKGWVSVSVPIHYKEQ